MPRLLPLLLLCLTACPPEAVFHGASPCESADECETLQQCLGGLCLDASCGDGVVQSGETCDDGNTEDDDECTTRCEPPRCGDGLLQQSEDCDDGNEVDRDRCRNNCELATCGDGVLRLDLMPGETGAEACDDGNTLQEDA